MSITTVTIVNTGVANTASVDAAFRRLGCETILTKSPELAQIADALVLPGVGTFDAGMRTLNQSGLVGPIIERIEHDRPTLAVCLGMQLLGESSDESPGVRGLAVVPSSAEAFPKSVCTPQFGWNRVLPTGEDEVVRPGHAYYANSFRFASIPEGWSGSLSEHGGQFVASIRRGNVLACQFHPELSGAWGAELLERWLVQACGGVAC